MSAGCEKIYLYDPVLQFPPSLFNIVFVIKVNISQSNTYPASLTILHHIFSKHKFQTIQRKSSMMNLPKIEFKTIQLKYIYIYIYIYIHECVCDCVCVFLCLCVYVCACASACACGTCIRVVK